VPARSRATRWPGKVFNTWPVGVANRNRAAQPYT
jgi:hypothetical protein